MDWQIISPQSIYCGLQFTNICKTTCSKVENEILNIVQVPCMIFTCWKLGPWWVIYSCPTLIYLHNFLPKSPFYSITLILICITVSIVTLSGNHLSFHFGAGRLLAVRGGRQFCVKNRHFETSPPHFLSFFNLTPHTKPAIQKWPPTTTTTAPIKL